MFLRRRDIEWFHQSMGFIKEGLENDTRVDMGYLTTREATPENTAEGVNRLLRTCGAISRGPQMDEHAFGGFANPFLRNVRIFCTAESAFIEHYGRRMPREYFVRRSARDRHDIVYAIYQKIRRDEKRLGATLKLREKQKQAARSRREAELEAESLSTNLAAVSIKPAAEQARMDVCTG